MEFFCVEIWFNSPDCTVRALWKTRFRSTRCRQTTCNILHKFEHKIPVSSFLIFQTEKKDTVLRTYIYQKVSFREIENNFLQFPQLRRWRYVSKAGLIPTQFLVNPLTKFSCTSYRTESFGISRIILVLYFTYVLQKHDTRVYTNLRQKYRFLE